MGYSNGRILEGVKRGDRPARVGFQLTLEEFLEIEKYMGKHDLPSINKCDEDYFGNLHNALSGNDLREYERIVKSRQ